MVVQTIEDTVGLTDTKDESINLSFLSLVNDF